MTKCKHGIEDDLPCALCRDTSLNWALPVLVVICIIGWAWLFSVLANAIKGTGL